MSKVIEIAKTQVGVKEEPSGSNKVKYNTWFYGKAVEGPNYAWCGTFVSWSYAESGKPLGTIDYLKGFAGCPFAVRNMKKWGRLVTVPQSGDVVFFDWNGDGTFDHTGLFDTDLGGGFFQSVEGNTAIGNDSNGGEVMIRKRSYKFAIFVRPRVVEK
jgi:hypothetical protein